MELLKIQIILLHISTVLSTGELVRLVNGSTPDQGRVEIYHNGEWGTICDDYFGNDEARVVCSALGYRDGSPFASAHFGRGTGTIFVDELHCPSSYFAIHTLMLGTTRCDFSGWGLSDCSHGEDVGVKCKSEFVRLVNGITPNQGRVEIYHNGEWGTICDDHFGSDEARAVCRALGYRDGIPYRGAHFGRGTGPIFVDNLDCSLFHYGTYHPLQLGRTECSFRGWNVSYCNHGKDVGVVCNVCNEDQFGDSCDSRCHCKVSGCNSVTGVCDSGDCLPGWRETSCSVACISGTFGQSCTSRCHCRSFGCDPITGVCTHQSSGCLAGWRGLRCDQECEDGRFGYSCSKRCHCKVPRCSRTTGLCKQGLCLPGWKGSSCSNACSFGTFGEFCSSKCHCRSSGCDPVTGVCTDQENGCLAGWRGTRCDHGDQKAEEQNSNTVGYKVAVSFSVIFPVLIVVLIIYFRVKYKRMKRKSDQPTTGHAARGPDVNGGLFAIALPGHRGLQDIARIGQENVAFHGAQVDIHLPGNPRNQRYHYNNKT